MGSFLTQGLSLGAGLLGNALGMNEERRSGGFESPYAGQVNQYLGMLSPFTQQEFDFYGQNMGNRFNAIDGAYKALDPANNTSLARSIAQRIKSGATAQGMGQAKQLQQRGYGESVQQGARLGAMNQANDQSGQIQLSLLDPQRMAGQQMQRAGLYDFGNIAQSMGAVNSLIGQGNSMAMQNYGTQQVQPSLLGSLYSAGMTMIPDIAGRGQSGQFNPYAGVRRAFDR